MSAVPKPKVRKQRKRFAHRRDPAYMAWIHTQPCIIAGRCYESGAGGLLGTPHECSTAIQGCHVKSRATGGDDRANLVSMCAQMHDAQHRGTRSFQARWGVNLREEAERLYALYRAACPRPVRESEPT